MLTALDIRGVTKRFTVGNGACLAMANVLRGVDLTVRAGECAVVIGARGSGKSTLMLCAAGLLPPDAGEVRWFGERSRIAAARRSLYHHAPSDLLRAGAAGEAHVHLVDVPAFAGASSDGGALDLWIAKRCDAGDAVLVAATDDALARRLGARVWFMRGGRLDGALPLPARVAEPVAG